jgi:glutathione S-transferase
MDAMKILHIGNKNYSSWSLRPWILMTELGIPFTERLHVFGPTFDARRAGSPTNKVPCLVDDGRIVWDSLAIAEYLAEDHPVWPRDRDARAWARCASAEMHSGFQALRTHCSMTCGTRVKLHVHPEALAKDVSRLVELWHEGLARFGGPFLAGASFTGVDAFFAPVAFRVQTYGLELPGAAGAYGKRLLGLAGMKRWYEEALVEPYRDLPHEEEIAAAGVVVSDFRKSPVMV